MFEKVQYKIENNKSIFYFFLNPKKWKIVPYASANWRARQLWAAAIPFMSSA
jgi:hypothetical protein